MFGITHFATLSDAERQDRKKVIFDLWLAGATVREIADKVDMSKTEIADIIKMSAQSRLEAGGQTEKPPIYNVWNYSLCDPFRCRAPGP